MYTIYISAQYNSTLAQWSTALLPLHHPNLAQNGNICINPVLKERVNSAGSLSFSVTPNHPYYDTLQPRKTYVTVFDDGVEIWRGRVISQKITWDRCKAIDCEGELAYLMDTLYMQNFSGTISDFLGSVITNHNSMVGEGDLRRFALGTVSVSGNVEVENDTAVISWDTLKKNLLDSFGGYLCIRKQSGTVYIDYVDDFPIVAGTQTVEYGKNLLDLVQTLDADDAITDLIPYGKDNITVESVNSGSKIVHSSAAAAVWIAPVYGTKKFGDVETASELLSVANEYMTEQLASKFSIDAGAADLSLIQLDVSRISVGTYVEVISTMHEIDMQLLCTEKTTELVRPSNTRIVFGAGQRTLTDLQGGLMADVRNN